MQRSASTKRTDNINLRITPAMLGLIDRAALVFGKTRTDFILDTVRKAAEEAVLDQRLFILDDEQWQAFKAALDAPPRDNTALNALLSRKPAWDK